LSTTDATVYSTNLTHSTTAHLTNKEAFYWTATAYHLSINTVMTLPQILAIKRTFLLLIAKCLAI